MTDSFVHSSPIGWDYSRVSKKLSAKFNPERHTFSGNFTPSIREFNLSPEYRRASLRRDILDTVMRRTETVMGQGTDVGNQKYSDDNPMYEDPRDVIVIDEKPPKPPRKRNLPPPGAVSSPRDSKDRSLKKKFSKKYESLIAALIKRCEDNALEISEKDSYILKLKEKLKTVLEYNKLFAEENDQLKNQYTTLAKYVEECKRTIREEREKYKEVENKRKELEEKVKKFELPDREHSLQPSAIPLVEVCMSCSSRQILLNQARDHNTALQHEMQALKDVLYRLNVQLARYQQRLRTNAATLSADKDQAYRPGDNLDSLIGASLGFKGEDGDGTENTNPPKCGRTDDHTGTGRVVDVSGLLSAQALAPLFDAYQENLQEKDSLIQDYEKQFENMNKKSKQIVEENKLLTQKVKLLEEDLEEARRSYKKLVVEKETGNIEKATLVERAERAETKLKEVYELYEDKMAAMMRDYETVHREYFTVKNALDATSGKVAQLDALRARTVPADLHERRLHHCNRLLEELKHQYTMESERKTEQLKKAERELKILEEKYSTIYKDHEVVKAELNTALKNVRLYRKAAVIFRARAQASKARATRRRGGRGEAGAGGGAGGSHEHVHAPPLVQALHALENIKREIKVVKSRAHTSLEELERRIKEQERRAATAQAEHRRELERAELALEHKEGIIKSLIDKVADVEEVRLSQTNTSRLQGIISDSEPSSPKPQAKPAIKLVPGSGGYFQDTEGKTRGSSK